jgi:YhcH/YjgK/YiaL family protein
MIADRLVNAHRYSNLGPRIARAFEFLEQTDLDAAADGRHDIEGADLFALVQHYTSKTEAEGAWEAHRTYADLQFVVAGEERIGYGPIERFEGRGHNSEKDLEFFTGQGDILTLEAGGFVLLWPGEVHMPQLAVTAPAPVKKIVVKIRVD